MPRTKITSAFKPPSKANERQDQKKIKHMFLLLQADATDKTTLRGGKKRTNN
jgi:hypothetical protein